MVYLLQEQTANAMGCLDLAITSYCESTQGTDFEGTLRVIHFHNYLAWMHLLKALTLTEQISVKAVDPTSMGSSHSPGTYALAAW